MSLRTAILDAICDQRHHMPLLLTVTVVMGVLTLISFLLSGPNAAQRPILVLDAILVGVAFALFSTAFWYCTKREMTDDEAESNGDASADSPDATETD